MTRYAIIPVKAPYWALEQLVDHLSLRVAELEAAVEAARRDPGEYRRGYLAGYRAAERGGSCAPDDSVKRRMKRAPSA